MTMVRDSNTPRIVCTPQGSALCFGVTLAGLVTTALALSWVVGLFH